MSAAIRTARLVLTPADAELARAVLDGSGPPTARGWPGPEALHVFHFAAEHGADPGWLILRDGLVVGECGTNGPPDADGTVEIRYGIAPPERDQGLATEACAALTRWLLAQPGVQRVAASIHAAGNPASRRVLERCGFTLDRMDGRDAWYVLTGPQMPGMS
ncbi:GNAT family N-acetyltransferase [Sporichthya sp.]|uniref:GNAT family N-acetyltransferase n=1 Tax=Sporichthya sp. TaxID=65475 RepID=UPI0017FC112C|nr:GNAT family N-acetyltransferase [Sporichthya sp.]MBA3742083.1 GNAT family N-acetyltransferase [Sporichthya sp.]